MITPAFLALLINAIAETFPAAANESAADRAANLAFARTLFEAFHPANAVQAAMAAHAVASHLAMMDSYARAAKPGLSDIAATRLRSNAIAASRVFDTVLRTLDRQRQPAPAIAQPRAPAPATNPTAPAARVYHRAELPPLIPGMAETVAATARKSDWRSGTALAPVLPTVLAPG
jgi:hypothetical protein